ncbi:30S ribosomal protein S7 [Candidatus Curtissbacteria bacterium RIFCSPLOWO2_01_FULL_42_26]|uniref:Small ribosomal subunit protein uS7 n=1 Tax=Candidatus Curtissbacteria bacterium RIFCSPLOWO2_01_FULL_42_26 TaxID=1797729 RepID=A0A1F5I1J1_9BACT|nr:MAG: 30S ribosomal protein S7 [Candidatus Curtissbacteria bacterium RIFCSPLOWO2_01_FULL_42_26]
MPRSGKIEKKPIQADPIYGNLVVAKLINKVMRDGKKSLAQKIVYGAFGHVKSQGHDPVKTFEKALENITPKMEVRPRRVGGASYMVPMEVRGARRQSLALSWLVKAAVNRPLPDVSARFKNKPVMIVKLAQEILEASQNTGNAISKKEEMNRMAEANKAFAHFRW